MMKSRRKTRRLVLIGAGLAVLSLASALVFVALNESMTFFKSPSEIAAAHPAPDERLRLGGLVKAGSVSRSADAVVSFEVTDGAAVVPVRFTGLLPDLFREGQGVVAEGAVNAEGVFIADTVLAKHDETYMPREVADSLKAQGHWKPDQNGQPVP